MLPGKPGGGRTPQKASDRGSTILAAARVRKSAAEAGEAPLQNPRRLTAFRCIFVVIR